MNFTYTQGAGYATSSPVIWASISNCALLLRQDGGIIPFTTTSTHQQRPALFI